MMNDYKPAPYEIKQCFYNDEGTETSRTFIGGYDTQEEALSAVGEVAAKINPEQRIVLLVTHATKGEFVTVYKVEVTPED